MGLYYSDGSRVGGCGTQVAGLMAVIACFFLHDLGISIGWSILIVAVVSIIIMILLDTSKD